MSILSKWLNKVKNKKDKKKLAPEMEAWGLEIGMESLLDIMDPDTFKVVKKRKLYQIQKYYKNKDLWERWYTHHGDSDKAGLFTTEDNALDAISKIIEKAANDFDDLYEQLKNLEHEMDS